MKRMIMALIAATTMSVGAMAQDTANVKREQRPRIDKTEMVKRHTDEAVKKYGLNEEQAQHLLELNTKYADKLSPGRGPRMGGNGPRLEMRDKKPAQRPDSLAAERRPRMERGGNFAQMRENREAYQAELKNILTEEQFKAYQEDEAKRMKQAPRQGQRQKPHRDNDNKQ